MQDVQKTTKLYSSRTFSTINYHFGYQIRNLIGTENLLITCVTQIWGK